MPGVQDPADLMQQYINPQGFLAEDDPRRALAAAVRAIGDELATSTASPEQFARAGELVAQAVELLARERHDRPVDFPSEASLLQLDHPHFLVFSPFSGALNPLAMPLRLRLDGEDAVGEVTYTRAYEGPPGCVHGGMIAGGFDEVLGYAQANSDRPGMTARLSVTYRRPTPLYRPLEYRSRIVSVQGRKITAKGTLTATDTGELCAESEALFVALRTMPGVAE